MTPITSVTLDAPDPARAEAFYAAAFGLEGQVRVRASGAPTPGFRGFTLSLTVSRPSTVDALVAAALEAGATPIRPAKKSLWGYGGVVQAPDGAIWKVATSAKKDTGPPTTEIDDLVLLLGAADVAESRRFYVDQGLTVARSYGRKYVEFDMPGSPMKLALYGRRALAKAAGVPPDGSGPHGMAIDGDLGPVTDPDGFTWQPGSRAEPGADLAGQAPAR